MRPFQRRTFVKTALAALLVGRDAYASSAHIISNEFKLRMLLSDRRHAQAIGRAALLESENEVKQDWLIKTLLERHPSLILTRPIHQRRMLLRRAIQSDFHFGETGLVQGWLLARSEIELCMIEYLGT